jgi:hypothetical protein
MGFVEHLRETALVLLSLLYVPIIFAASREAREVTKDDPERDGGTVYFPIVYCLPTSYSIDGSIISVDVNDIGKSSWKNCLVALQRSFQVSQGCQS